MGCLCEEEDGKVLHVARAKENEKTKHIGFAQEESTGPKVESNKGSE